MIGSYYLVWRKRQTWSTILAAYPE